MQGETQSIQKIKLGFTWCYLLKASEGYLLIDTSYPEAWPKFRQALGRLAIEPSEIKTLLLTHHHDDHAGFAAELVERTGCRVIAHRSAIEALRRGASDETMRPFNRRVGIVFSLFSLFHRDFSFPPVILNAEDVLIQEAATDFPEQLGIDGRILHTPGHSKDSISLLLSDGSAFVGDAAMNFLRFTGVGHHPIYVEDVSQVYESWQTIIDQGARVIYPSHGPPFPAQELGRCALCAA